MDQIWWNHIIKAHAFLENIVKEAAGGHSLLLTLPDSVPWKSTFLAYKVSDSTFLWCNALLRGIISMCNSLIISIIVLQNTST